MTSREGEGRKIAMSPARRASKTLRVHSRFTPTRSSVYRLDRPVDPAALPVPDDGVEEFDAVEPIADPAVVEQVDAVGPVDEVDDVDAGDEVDELEQVTTAEDPDGHGPPGPDDTEEQPDLEALFALPDADVDRRVAVAGPAVDVPSTDHVAPVPPARLVRSVPPARPVRSVPPVRPVRPVPPVRAVRPPRRVDRSRWLPFLVVAVAVAILVVVLTVRGLTGTAAPTSAGAPPSSGTTSSTPVGASLGDWLAAQDDGVRVVVDSAATSAAVAAAGVTPAAVGLDRAEPGDRVVRAAPAGAVGVVVTASAGAAVVPVDTFPGEAGVVLVGGVTVPGTPADITAARADAAATARAACSALLRNAAVTVTPSASVVLDTGAVDIRVVAFLVTVAERQAVKVTAFAVDDAERAAGIPSRSVTLTGAGSDDIAAVVARASGPFAPTAVVAAPGGGTTVTWAVVPDPADLTLR